MVEVRVACFSDVLPRGDTYDEIIANAERVLTERLSAHARDGFVPTAVAHVVHSRKDLYCIWMAKLASAEPLP